MGGIAPVGAVIMGGIALVGAVVRGGPHGHMNSTTSDVEINIGEKTESVNSQEEAYCDGEPDKVNPCFIIRQR